MSDNVTIKIGAQDGASRVLDAVAAKVGGLGTSFASLNPAMLAGGAAVAAVAAAGAAAVASIANVSSKIDELVDKSAGLGAAVADLQAFQFAMNEAGGVDGAGSIQALQRIQKLVGEVAAGDNEAASNIFTRLGVDANELSMQGPVDQFMQLKGAIAGIENISERAATAQQLLGKSAADLIPALISEQSAFEASMKAANELGLTVSENGAQSIAAMNDAVGRVQAGFEGVVNQVAVSLAPAVEVVASEIVQWLPPVVSLVEDLLPAVITNMAQVADIASEIPRRLGRAMEGDFFSPTKFEDTWEGAIDRARRKAMEAADQAKIEREAIVSVRVNDESGKSKADKQLAAEAEKSQAAYDKTIEQLTERIAVAERGADAVKREQELALARNDAERERIAILQDQVSKVEAINAQRKIAEDMAKRASDAIKAETDRIKEQQILLEKGAEAARRFALEQKGIDSQTAKQLAAQQERIDQRKQMVDVWSPQQATQGRLLTMGPVAGQFDRLLGEVRKQNENQRLQLDEQKYGNAKLDAIYRDSKNKTIYLETLTVS